MTKMNKLLFLMIGAAVGAVAAYLMDPERGRSRRARLTDQASARGRDLSETMRQKAEYQKGVVRGKAHEVSDSMRPDKKYDDETLLRKVRSEALGHWDSSAPIEVDITDGMVRLSGSVESPESRHRLLSLIRDVEGVGLIDDRLTVRV